MWLDLKRYQPPDQWPFFFFKQKTAYEIMPSLVGSEMCIRDRLDLLLELLLELLVVLLLLLLLHVFIT